MLVRAIETTTAVVVMRLLTCHVSKGKIYSVSGCVLDSPRPSTTHTAMPLPSMIFDLDS